MARTRAVVAREAWRHTSGRKLIGRIRAEVRYRFYAGAQGRAAAWLGNWTFSPGNRAFGLFARFNRADL